jgi:hypothetical protein
VVATTTVARPELPVRVRVLHRVPAACPLACSHPGPGRPRAQMNLGPGPPLSSERSDGTGDVQSTEYTPDDIYYRPRRATGKKKGSLKRL